VNWREYLHPGAIAMLGGPQEVEDKEENPNDAILAFLLKKLNGAAFVDSRLRAARRRKLE
jgi:hypothetical protein